MNKDPRVQAATAHWSGRFVSNGVPLADFQDVTNSIDRWETWCEAWSARGAIHEALGRESLAAGFKLSAGQHLTVAGVCYHFGKFLFVQDPDQMQIAHRKAVECRNLALENLSPAGERVAIPYEGKTLYGNLRKPIGTDRPSVVVMAMGLDSAKEEMETNEGVFLERGMATLAFDGPGQGEAEYDFAICPEYERPVGAVIEWLSKRTDINSENLGIWGVSLGGYYAPRAAAFDHRIKACISLTGPFDLSACFDNMPGLTQAAFIHRSKAGSKDAARKFSARLSLHGIAEKITCPLYVVAGKLDRVIPHEHALQLADSVTGETTLNLVEDGGHVANNRIYKYRNQSADWMADKLVIN